MWPPLFEIAFDPSPSPAAAAASRASAIVPPFNPNALAPTLIPFASASADATAYRNNSVSVPLPLAYDAWRVEAPTSSASCGVPVTVTKRVNVTFTSIVSPSKYVSPPDGLLAIATPLADAAVSIPPSTLCAPLFAIARKLRIANTAFAVPPVAAIVPPFKPNAPAPTLNPSASASPDATTYRNASVAEPLPDT